MHIKKSNQVKVFSIKLLCLLCLSNVLNVQAQQPLEEKESTIQASYLESKEELIDYILDTGDTLNIEFVNLPELSGSYSIDEQGEIYLERIKYAYVRGLTIKELTKLLEKRYEEFLLNPEIYIRISRFKSIRVAINGQVRKPGLIKFPSYSATGLVKFPSYSATGLVKSETELLNEDIEASWFVSGMNSSESNSRRSSGNRTTPSTTSNTIKRTNDYVATLSNIIQKAGGLTSYSDLSKIEVVRDVPLGKGGGKKRAIINFLPFINEGETSNDIRIFDGDSVYIPTLKERDISLTPKTILSGLSPKFITVSIAGQIENPGEVRIPIEGSLSDVMNLSGPRKPLAGKIYLIRYNPDGTLLRESIRFDVRATPGTERNPFLISGDLITVKNSILGRTSGTLKAITEPLLGIYATKEVVETISGEEL